jgi:hypothetical protein
VPSFVSLPYVQLPTEDLSGEINFTTEPHSRKELDNKEDQGVSSSKQ